MSDYQAACPFCGEEDLRATVTTVDTNIPLRSDGYSPLDGDPASTDITHVECGSCGKEVPRGYYFGSLSRDEVLAGA